MASKVQAAQVFYIMVTFVRCTITNMRTPLKIFSTCAIFTAGSTGRIVMTWIIYFMTFPKAFYHQGGYQGIRVINCHCPRTPHSCMYTIHLLTRSAINCLEEVCAFPSQNESKGHGKEQTEPVDFLDLIPFQLKENLKNRMENHFFHFVIISLFVKFYCLSVNIHFIPN